MTNRALWKGLRVLGECDFDETDPNSRGPFVSIGNLEVIDGAVMEVYGETLEEARELAAEILAMISWTHPATAAEMKARSGDER